uniref:Bm2240, isoform d n=1 Tax=Brugia malayi TaxID=6279 RepID=A0A1I9G1B4_BRUMA|nr:Bm2240, isoform d [Brugia malayi]
MIREKNYEDNVDKLISFEQTDWINEENQNTRLIKKLSQSNGLFIRGIAKDITSDVIQVYFMVTFFLFYGQISSAKFLMFFSVKTGVINESFF